MALSYVAGVAGRHSVAIRVASSSKICSPTAIQFHHAVPRRYASLSASSAARKKSFQRGRLSQQEDVLAKPQKGPRTAEDDAEELERLEKSMAYSHLMPTVDAWGQQIGETLDVVLPRTFDAKLWAKDPKQAYSDLKGRIFNSVKNIVALLTLRSEGGVSTLSAVMAPPRLDKSDVSWSRLSGIFSTSSTKDSAIMGPLRAIALDAYEQLNKGVANGDDKVVAQHTTSRYQTQALELCKSARSKKRRGGRMFWTLDRLVEPVTVVSVRVTQGYMATEEPRFGNRLMIHALVKFDTEQSLEIYDERGNPVHERIPEGEPVWISDTDKRESWRVPAKSKRVVEYLVLEKRAWVNGPWQFREQMW